MAMVSAIHERRLWSLTDQTGLTASSDTASTSSASTSPTSTPAPLAASPVAEGSSLPSGAPSSGPRKLSWSLLPEKLLHFDPSKDPRLFAL